MSAAILTGKPTRDALPKHATSAPPPALQPYIYTTPDDYAWICAPSEALAIEIAEARTQARRTRGAVRLVPVAMEAE